MELGKNAILSLSYKSNPQTYTVKHAKLVSHPLHLTIPRRPTTADPIHPPSLLEQ